MSSHYSFYGHEWRWPIILDMYRKEKFKSKYVNSKFANGALIEYGIRQRHPLAVLLKRQI